MPLKIDKFKDLKKKIKNVKKEKKKVTSTKYKPKETSTKQIPEETYRRKFFEKLHEDGEELTNKEILNRLNEFATAPSRDFTRENFINKLKKYLPRKNILEYAEEYLKSNLQSNFILDKYISKEEVQEIYEEEDKYPVEFEDDELKDIFEEGYKEVFEEDITGFENVFLEKDQKEEIPYTQPIAEYEGLKKGMFIAPEHKKAIELELVTEEPPFFIEKEQKEFDKPKIEPKQIKTTQSIDLSSKKIHDFSKKLLSNISDHDLSILIDNMEKQLEYSLKFIKNKNSLVKNTVELYLEKFKEKTIKELLESFSILLSYLDNRVLDIAKIFKERLERYHYDSNTLYRLTSTEVLPEIFMEPSTKNTEKYRINRFLAQLPKNIYNELLYKIYYDIHNLEKRIYPSQVQILGTIYSTQDGEGLKKLCKNIDQLRSDIEPYNIYIIKEDNGEYYCVDITEEIDPVFISEKEYQKLLKIQKNIEKNTKVIPKEVKIEEISEIEVEEIKTPGLFKFMMNLILDYEDTIGRRGEDYSNKIKSLEQDYNLTKKDNTKAEIEELTDKIENICSYCKSMVKSPFQQKEGSELVNFCNKECFEKSTIIKQDICSYCKKIIENNPISSIRQGKKGSEIVKFCNTACFEQFDKWPKLKKKEEKLEDYTTVIGKGLTEKEQKESQEILDLQSKKAQSMAVAISMKKKEEDKKI